jgi:hypothetical protein
LTNVPVGKSGEDKIMGLMKAQGNMKNQRSAMSVTKEKDTSANVSGQGKKKENAEEGRTDVSAKYKKSPGTKVTFS